MNASTPAVEQEPAVSAPAEAPAKAAARPGRKWSLGLDRFSGLYVWAALIVVFGVWMPDLFLTTSNARIIAGDEAITAILALGLVIPLAAGVFDLSIAGTMGFAAVAVTWYQSHGHSALAGAVLVILGGGAVGAPDRFLGGPFRGGSLIATPAVSSGP